MNNKENMIEVSLDLFSKRGFSGVSVRDICGKLNLKESALYYHFKNKEAILETLYQRVEILIESMRGTFDGTFENVNEVSTGAMQMVAKGFLVNYYCDNHVRRLLAMLNIERMSDSVANEKYRMLMYEMPLQQCERVFKKMGEKQIIDCKTPDLLAKEYLGIIIIAYDRYVLGNENLEKGIKRALDDVEREVGLFYEGIKR
ncbi:MAG: TetR/AcrR family transcriptional regulator [Eubacteriales bacterium]|nr:TetR/AcrR family transcriptional regulator [Eubacteriales bacterium]